MLGNYLKFNNVVFPNPKNPSRTSKTIENVSQSEAGTDLVTVVRPGKNAWSFVFDLSPAKRDILEGLTHDESTSMQYQGKTYLVRVRDFTENTVEGSEWLSSVDGLFECSVTVTEF